MIVCVSFCEVTDGRYLYKDNILLRRSKIGKKKNNYAEKVSSHFAAVPSLAENACHRVRRV